MRLVLTADGLTRQRMAERQRAYHAISIDFDVDQLALNPALVRRRIISHIGYLPSDPEQRAALEELVAQNEMDLAMAAAIQHGLPFDEDLKERRLVELEKRGAAAVDRLSPALRERWYGLTDPVWLNGNEASWWATQTPSLSMPAISSPTAVVARARESRPRRRRSSRAAARSPGRRSDDDPEPHDVAALAAVAA